MPDRRVLFVDDRPALLALRKESLEARGFSVSTALSILSALGSLETMPVDAVLLEYSLEQADPVTLAYLIKSRFPSLPIVLMSASFEIPEEILWLVDEYAPKSAMLDEVVGAIERVTHGFAAA